MLKQQGSPNSPSTATEEDVLRAYNYKWQDTAVGRAVHVATCPNTSHRNCGGVQ